MHYNLLIINKLSIKERVMEYEKILLEQLELERIVINN